MEYFVYIIYSLSKDRYYIGHCENLEKRLDDHKNGRSTYTKNAKDWEFRWTKSFPNRSAAMKVEASLKKKKSRRYLEYLIDGGSLS